MIPVAPRAKKAAPRKRRGAGRPAACEAAMRMESLLDTAAEVFLEQGYKNANVLEIAQRAGASKSTLYSRYPTKAELFVAVITRKTRQLQESFAEVLVPGRPLDTVLTEFGTHLLRAMTHPQRHALYKVFAGESPGFPKLARKFWEVGPRRSMEMLASFLESHPDFKGENPLHAAGAFWSLCCGLPILKAQFHQTCLISEKAIASIVNEAVRIFLTAYATAPSARQGDS